MSVERAEADNWVTRAGAGVIVAATALLVVAELKVIHPRHAFGLLMAFVLLALTRGDR